MVRELCWSRNIYLNWKKPSWYSWSKLREGMGEPDGWKGQEEKVVAWQEFGLWRFQWSKHIRSHFFFCLCTVVFSILSAWRWEFLLLLGVCIRVCTINEIPLLNFRKFMFFPNEANLNTLKAAWKDVFHHDYAGSYLLAAAVWNFFTINIFHFTLVLYGNCWPCNQKNVHKAQAPQTWTVYGLTKQVLPWSDNPPTEEFLVQQRFPHECAVDQKTGPEWWHVFQHHTPAGEKSH